MSRCGPLNFGDKSTTKAQDGGFDIPATLDTELGRLMWPIETKLYGTHHKVGFDLVQRPYGVYASYVATHGMLVTSSSFTTPARELQAKHSYHLTLREYRDVLNWIERYGTHRRTSGCLRNHSIAAHGTYVLNQFPEWA